MRPYKAVLAKPYEGKDAWYGLYYDGKHWHTVRNQQNLSIIYKTSADAMKQAKLKAEEIRT